MLAPLRFHGFGHIIDVPYHGEVYGDIDSGVQIRSGRYVDASGQVHEAPVSRVAGPDLVYGPLAG